MKSRIYVFVCHQLSQGVYVCTLNSTHTHPFPLDNFFIPPFMDTLKKCLKLVTTIISRLLTIFSASVIIAASGPITVLWGF